MIKVRNLHMSFGGKAVLTGIDLEIHRGEKLAIIGKSGCGKSVLLRCILGLLDADAGEVEIENISIRNAKMKDLQKIRQRIGVVFQSGALFDSMTVGDNVRMALEKLTDYPPEKVESVMRGSLADVGLDGSENLMPAELSGGMRKRAGIARAISFSPEYLFYDEPTTGLDPIMTHSIMQLIEKVRKELHTTAIIVTHEMKFIFEFVDRVIMLNDGNIVFDGAAKDTLSSNNPELKKFVTQGITKI